MKISRLTLSAMAAAACLSSLAFDIKDGSSFDFKNLPPSGAVRLSNGATTRFAIEENGTTGYGWVVQYDTNLCTVAMKHLPGETKNGICGAPGKVEVSVTRKSATDTASFAMFEYRRPWEKNVAAAQRLRVAVVPAERKRDAVMIFSAHPDDLIVCLGFCHLARDIYDIHVVDFTHGERGCGQEKFLNGWTKTERTKEETAVCKSVGATLHWMDEIDGEAYAGRETCERMAALIREIKPRAVLGHWPVDIHTDHVMTGAAMLRASFLSGVRPEIWFFGQHYQSKRYTPDVLVDVSAVNDEIYKSLNLYKCQLSDGIMERHERVAKKYYGMQSAQYYDGHSEGFKAMVLPFSGDRTIFTDLPRLQTNGGDPDFEGIR